MRREARSHKAADAEDPEPNRHRASYGSGAHTFRSAAGPVPDAEVLNVLARARASTERSWLKMFCRRLTKMRAGGSPMGACVCACRCVGFLYGDDRAGV